MLYTKLDDQSLQQIVQQFDIAPVLRWQVLEGGVENTNHLLETAQEKYILTICERKTFEETTVLVDLLKHLENHHFETTKIIPNKTGQNISVFNNKPTILKTYVAGKIINIFGEEILKKIGEAIGQLHLLPAPDYLPKVYAYGEQEFFQLNTTKIVHPFVDWLNDKHASIKKNIKPTLPKTLIHGDIFFSNVIIAEQGQATIIDFEEACYYYRMYDIGMAIVGLCNEKGKINFSKADILINGYEQIIQLENIEKELLKTFIGYAATATAFWRFRQFNIIVPTPARQDTYLEMKKIADDMESS